MTESNSKMAFIKSLPNNIFAGFVVSLVALPLGFGLALASGVPPIAGIISAVVGGVIVSIIGGSNVTITGPGNGLVVAVFTAVTTLGAGDMQAGYLITLAAIIVSGVLIFLLSFINLGKLTDFFPSSAIQGMLAAIGIIIISKQIHIVFGNLNATGSPFELLLSLPKSIFECITDPGQHPAAIAGIASLLIMVFYAKIRSKYFQLIPAPMWIVFISVGLAHFFENKLGVDHPIPSQYFIKIPDNIFSNFPVPNFTRLADFDFIVAVFSITMIAAIESLLSIKGVEKLDPLLRKSNVNKDIRALGIATVVSGFLGGLNVVTVIARSSVNVNNNGSNRSANFFHAAFLCLFILVFKEQLGYIPYPALAAILVYTGYKLASPATFKKIMSIGKEQVFIFLVTLITTLATSLITGITVGIVVTFFVHLYLTNSFKLFFENFKKNNLEESFENDGTLHITVKYFSSYLNFFRLKAVLDKIKPNEKVIVDFLQSRFVDHTVMENLWDYEQKFEKSGGQFDVIGLDLHSAESDHPFALRRALELVPFVHLPDRMTRRQQEISNFTGVFDWKFNKRQDFHIYFLMGFNYFKTRQIDHVYNIAQSPERTIKLFDIEYSEGAFIAEEQLHSTMVYIKTNQKTPQFTLDKGDFFERMQYLADFKEIKLKSFRDFAKRFTLRGENLLSIRRFFTDDLILFFESNSYYHIESDGKGGILIKNSERLGSVTEIKALVDFSIRLEAIINRKNDLM
jgi:carbonic anhydrase